MSEHKLTRPSSEPDKPESQIPQPPPSNPPKRESSQDATSENLPGWLLLAQAVSGISEGLLRLSEQIGGQAGQCEGHFAQITQILSNREALFSHIAEEIEDGQKDNREWSEQLIEGLSNVAQEQQSLRERLERIEHMLLEVDTVRRQLSARAMWTAGILALLLTILQAFGINVVDLLQFFSEHVGR